MPRSDFGLLEPHLELVFHKLLKTCRNFSEFSDAMLDICMIEIRLGSLLCFLPCEFYLLLNIICDLVVQMDLDLLNFLLKVGDDGFAVLMIIAEYYQLINVQKR